MEVRQIGNIMPTKSRDNPNQGRVYSTDGLCPALTKMDGGGRQPMIVANVNPSGKGINGNVHDSQDVAPTMTTNKGEGVKIIVAMRERNPDNPSDRTVGSPTEQRLEPNSQGICNTITTVQKDNMVMETVAIKQATAKGYIECEVGGVADLSYPTSKTRRRRVQDMGRVSPTITATKTGVHRIESQYRIRKLTPNETWRLMDFSDEDFHKAEAVCSSTQLYKQAGNSIVRNVLVAIFGQMIPGKEEVYKNVVS